MCCNFKGSYVTFHSWGWRRRPEKKAAAVVDARRQLEDAIADAMKKERGLRSRG
jgi:hypothetical protein